MEEKEGVANPHFLDKDTGRYVLSSEDNVALQRYVHAVRSLELPEQVRPEHKDLKEFDDDATKAANDWINTLFPRTVALAADISTYCTQSSAIFKRMALLSGDITSGDKNKADNARKEVLKMFEYLKENAEKNYQEANGVFEELNRFATQLTDQKNRVSKLEDAYTKMAGSDASQGLRRKMEKLKDKVEKLNKEYEKAVVVAATTPTYAWIFPVGLIAAATVAGIYGAKATDLKKQISEATDECRTIKKELNYQEELVNFAKTHLKSISGIEDAMVAVLPVFESIKGTWGAIRDDLANIISKALDSVDPTRPIYFFEADIAEKLWLEIKDKVDAYRASAYITVTTT